MLSIIIPTKNEKYLERTIEDLLNKCTGDIEIIVVLDGYNPPERNPRVTYIHLENSVGMREAINAGVEASKGEYIMKIDAHCIIDKGMDEKLIASHNPDWVQIPRRYKLDEENWKPQEEYIDYEYYIFPKKYTPVSLHGFRWTERMAQQRELIDDTLTFQGSCYFMTREFWDKNNFLKDERYGTLPAQEATYIGNTIWLNGGRVVVNKNTWYSHLHKKKESGRGYHMSPDLQRKCYRVSYDYWTNEKKEGFIKLIEKFWPLPGWPRDWKERLWTQ